MISKADGSVERVSERDAADQAREALGGSGRTPRRQTKAIKKKSTRNKRPS